LAEASASQRSPTCWNGGEIDPRSPN
jgi:hypothetical protein